MTSNVSTGRRRFALAVMVLVLAAVAALVSGARWRVDAAARPGYGAPTGSGRPIGAGMLPDPRQPGSLAVTAQEYNFGDDAAHVPGVTSAVELRGVVHRPVDAKGKRLPLVVLEHGLYFTCLTRPGVVPSGATLKWPCPKGLVPVPSFRGYDYLAANLASHGFVVVSISANGITPAEQDASWDLTPRARLIGVHLKKIAAWNTTGGAPFGNALLGAIDQHRLGIMGHSRSGGAVARYATLLPNKDFTLKAVLPLAPAVEGKDTITDIALGVVLPLCDGDAYQHQGVFYVDHSRYAERGDTAPKYTVTIEGANHNFFNTVWSKPIPGQPGIEDDTVNGPPGSVCKAGSPRRLDQARQRDIATGYLGAFFRYHLAAERALAPLWRGDLTPAWATSVVQVARHPRDTRTTRGVINRLATERDVTGSVRARGFADLRVCSREQRIGEAGNCLTNSRKTPTPDSEPHHSWGDLSMVKAAWTRPGAGITTPLAPGLRDVRRFRAIQVRAALDFTDVRNPAGRTGRLQFVLTDAFGRSRTVTAGGNPALSFPRMTTTITEGYSDLYPHFLLNQVRVPLSAFTGVDLTRIRSVTLRFPHRSGSLGLSDLMFTD
ncbi:hypothetical protein [Pseudosporangium ferrugineum]|nr:hypothetical protein [Pseudosporangium ferrugineum]